MKSPKECAVELFRAHTVERTSEFASCQGRISEENQEMYLALEARISEAGDQASVDAYIEIFSDTAGRLLSSIERNCVQEDAVFLSHLKTIKTISTELKKGSGPEVDAALYNKTQHRHCRDYQKRWAPKEGKFAAYSVLETHYNDFFGAAEAIKETSLYATPAFEALRDLLINYSIDDRAVSADVLSPHYFSSIQEAIKPFQRVARDHSAKDPSIHRVKAIVSAFRSVANEAAIGSIATKGEDFFEIIYQKQFNRPLNPPSYEDVMRMDSSSSSVSLALSDETEEKMRVDTLIIEGAKLASSNSSGSIVLSEEEVMDVDSSETFDPQALEKHENEVVLSKTSQIQKVSIPRTQITHVTASKPMQHFRCSFEKAAAAIAQVTGLKRTALLSLSPTVDATLRSQLNKNPLT